MNEPTLLKNAYYNSLQLAAKYHLASIAFPNISTGVYGYPLEAAADIAIETVLNFKNQAGTVKQVIFVCFDTLSYDIYKNKLAVLGII